MRTKTEYTKQEIINILKHPWTVIKCEGNEILLLESYFNQLGLKLRNGDYFSTFTNISTMFVDPTDGKYTYSKDCVSRFANVYDFASLAHNIDKLTKPKPAKSKKTRTLEIKSCHDCPLRTSHMALNYEYCNHKSFSHKNYKDVKIDNRTNTFPRFCPLAKD